MGVPAGHSGRVFYAGLLEALIEVMGTAKGYLYDHGPRVAHLAHQLGHRLGLSDHDIAELLFAAVLTDVGMIGLVEEAWENPVEVLDADSRERVVRHPGRSEQTVLSIPHLEGLAPLVRHHHEWWDGTGYPDSLAGTDVPLGAQILRLADTVAALGEDRPQRPALTDAQIRIVVQASQATEFGPEVARIYLRMFDGGELTEYHPALFHRTLVRAAEVLLPGEVSPLSSDQLLEILASVIDAKDPYTAGHSRRVAILAVALANRLGLADRLRETLWAAGYLHDLGKLSVPLKVLAKSGPLEPAERHLVQAHAQVGAQILERIPSLKHLAAGARYHHERWDGTGYPEGIAGENIPIVAQILAVCDAYDAMSSDRAYRRCLPHEIAMEEIAMGTGRHFAPRVAAAFLALPDHLFQSVRQARAPLRRTPFSALAIPSRSVRQSAVG